MGAMVSSGMSAGAVAFMHMGDKKAGNVDPKIEKAIMQLNKALQVTIKDAVTDLTAMLRFFPVLLIIMQNSVDRAERLLLLDYKESPPKSKKYVTDMIKVASEAFKAQKQVNYAMIGQANEAKL